MAIDLTDRIERLEAYEERCAMQFEALSAFVEATWGRDPSEHGWAVTVSGEVHATNGERLPHPIRVAAALYDAKGRVATKLGVEIGSKTFFLLEPFQLEGDHLPVRDFSRILVYAVPVE